ncbi:hypothetical protein GQ457_16G016160 [Hibiscus cannabinus]
MKADGEDMNVVDVTAEDTTCKKCTGDRSSVPNSFGKVTYASMVVDSKRLARGDGIAPSFIDEEVNIMEEDIVIDHSGTIPLIKNPLNPSFAAPALSPPPRRRVAHNHRPCFRLRLVNPTGTSIRNCRPLFVVDLRSKVRRATLALLRLSSIFGPLPSSGRGSVCRSKSPRRAERNPSCGSPFRHRVVKVDYNTDAGLQQICYSCGVYCHSKDFFISAESTSDILNEKNSPNVVASNIPIVEVFESNLFEPWMLVDNRIRRGGSTLLSSKSIPSITVGSHFSSLTGVDDGDKTRIHSDEMDQWTKGCEREFQRNAAYMASNPNKKSKAGKNDSHVADAIALVYGAIVHVDNDA